MTRLLSFLALVVLLLVTAGALVLYLSYGIDTQYPAQVSAGVSAETHIGWHDGYTHVDAPDAPSLYTALGMVHGTRQAWPIVLWRQVALARASEWYGSGAAALDSLSLQLGIRRGAQQAYHNLPQEQRERLEAYARGVNLALSRRSARLTPEFTILGIRPERWEPWHSLAIERLFAWIALPPPADSLLAEAPADVSMLAQRTAELETLLGLHDLDHSAVFVTQGTDPLIGVRFVYGSSTVPPIEEHLIEVDGGRRLVAVIPGTPFPLLAAGGDRAVIALPGGTAELVTTIADSADVRPVHERITDRDGNELVVEFIRSGSSVLLAEAFAAIPDTTAPDLSTPADTLETDTVAVSRPVRHFWMLRWHGMDAPSDAAAFHAMLMGDVPSSFGLFRGGMIHVDGDGTPAVAAPEASTARTPDALVVGHERWVDGLVRRVQTLVPAADSLGIEAIMDDVHSVWADSLVGAMTRSAGSIPEPPPAVDDALTYLRNWNAEYDGANIAATMFDNWVSAYLDSTGRLPSPSEADTLFEERFLRYQLLAETVSEMAARYGDEMSLWRWERAQPDVRHAPGFPVTDPGFTIPTNRRYRPVELPGRGHPSTIRFGTTPLERTPEGSASWEAWFPAARPDSIRVRRRRIDVHSFRDRYMMPDGEPEPLMFTPADDEPVTVLLP